MKSAHDMPFGASLTSAGARFAIWAPSVAGAEVVVDGRRVPMQRDARGFFHCFDDRAAPGSRYAFRFAGVEIAVPDPASRFNPDGVHEPSELVDANAYEWRDGGWRGRPFHDAVIYELHVGTFTPQGTYAAAAERLDYLASLGVTALELMPLAATPGRWNWGYDGVLPFAPHAPYGRPDDLKRFIDAAHERGLMVLLDVVYNHFGPEGNYLGHYAQEFFTARHRTPWGNGINFDDRSSAVARQFFIHNALYWLDEYHFDGLRLDAVHAIIDDSKPSFLRELAAAVHAMPDGRTRHLVLENDRNDAALLTRDAQRRPQSFTAQWNDDFHHTLYVLLTAEQRGHYADYAEPGAQLLRALREGFAYQGEHSANRKAARGTPSAHLPPEAFVNFLQNHDQIGNRPDAARMWALLEPGRMLAAESLLALLPTPILLFMGDEFHAPSGFPFFCDFGEDLARAVTEGRRAEFGSFWHDTADEVPGPATEAARVAAVLDWAAPTREPHKTALARARERFALRGHELAPRLPAQAAGGTLLGPATLIARWLLADGSTLTVCANLADTPFAGAPAARGRTLLATAQAGSEWPPWYVAWTLA
ncbi:MAG TPA: malto-oligosyltrehalose trehalohydrolase [Gammaproteobacteria bacterium]|nr:malto-oligosyltrehalose trehalohydrolase [Gammaproteobacteria bacterium]